MTELDRVPWLAGVHVGGRSRRTESLGTPLERSILKMEDAVASLRREAVAAVLRLEELQARLTALEERTGPAERGAALALERGEDRLALQILYRELPTLGLRDLLQAELVETRRRTVRLLNDAARLNERARRARQTGSS